MLLAELLSPSCIKVPLSSKDSQGAIAELVELLDAKKVLSDKKAVLEAVLTRERTRSTGIGSGIAIPHGKCKGVKELVMAMGLAETPIDFGSVDGQRVKIVILLVSPMDQTGPHIQALAQISRLMLDQDFKSRIESARSGQEVRELFRKKEAE